jgi:DNA repair protein SbcD/Mre11
LNTVKFLHTADLHLDSPFQGLQKLPESIFKRIKESTFASFSRIVSLAIEEKVHFMIISGDLFDSEDRSLRAQVRFRQEMKRLEDADIPVYVIHGNHDHLGGSWTSIEWPNNVYVFSNELEIKSYEKNGQKLVNLYGFSYPEKAVTENKTSYYQKQSDAPFHIGILHGSADGSRQGMHGQYAPFTVKQLLEKEFDYWALGHIHKRQTLYENPFVVYPGNIQGRHRNELGEKGCFLVTLTPSKAELSFKQTADIIWEHAEISITEVESYSELVDKCYQLLETFRRIEEGVILSIDLNGTGKLHKSLLDKNLIDELLTILMESEIEKKNFVLVNIIRVQTNLEVDRERLVKESHFFADLLSCIDEYDDFFEALAPVFNHPQARKYVTQLTNEDKQEILKEAETLLLNGMMKE